MFKKHKEAFNIIKLVTALLFAIAAIFALINSLSPLFKGSALEELTVGNIITGDLFILVIIFGLLLIFIVALFIFVLYDSVLSKWEFLKIPESVLGKIIAMIIIIIFLALIALVFRPSQFAFFASFVSISAIIWSVFNSINLNKK